MTTRFWFSRALASVRRRIGLWHNVPPLDAGPTKEGCDKGLLAAGPSFSYDEIKAHFELVKNGSVSIDDFVSAYPENSVNYILSKDGHPSIVVDTSFIRGAIPSKS